MHGQVPKELNAQKAMGVQFQKDTFIGWKIVALSNHHERNVFEEIQRYLIGMVEPELAVRQFIKRLGR